MSSDTGAPPPTLGRPVVERGRTFAVASAGRCGTTTLARVFDLAGNARVHHHPDPHFVEETLAAYHGRVDPMACYWAARGRLIEAAWAEGRVYGETDCHMTAFAPALASALPRMRCLFALRHPGAVVRSGMRRGWYAGHPWDRGRLRPAPGDAIAAEWPSLPAFDKICWLWGETHRRMASLRDSLPPDRWRAVRFEAFAGDGFAWDDLFAFLGLRPVDPRAIADVMAQRLNRQETGAFPRWADWTAEQRAILRRYCAAAAEDWQVSL